LTNGPAVETSRPVLCEAAANAGNVFPLSNANTHMNTTGGSPSTTRLYGALIGLVSGGYSVWLATTGTAMTTSAWWMLALGVIVLVHGAILMTPAARRLEAASGPLMIGYAVLMLGTQAWMAAMAGTMGSTTGMGAGGGMGGMGGTGGMLAGMGVDAGMVALAVVMLGSGLLMTRRGEMG
jgi:hypothetical protein